jgi:hypothetical protein
MILHHREKWESLLNQVGKFLKNLDFPKKGKLGSHLNGMRGRRQHFS